jgi:hypothetical protein
MDKVRFIGKLLFAPRICASQRDLGQSPPPALQKFGKNSLPRDVPILDLLRKSVANSERLLDVSKLLAVGLI